MKDNDYLDIKSLEEYINVKDIQILRMLREFYTLENKLKRYRKKLTLEGFQVAREYELEKFNLKKHGNYVNTFPIIELAQINYPSLYRRYYNLEKKYFEVLDDLRILLRD